MFVVGYLTCPDQMFVWEDILQIRLIANSAVLCPICLSPPDAARVTKCGHTYCLPCILHFFSSTEGKWEPCPVCGELIKLSDSKPVVTLEKREFKPGDLVNLVKVCRSDSFNYPLPCYLDRGESRRLMDSSERGVQFAKVCTGAGQFRRQALLTDRRELNVALKNTLCDIAFVYKALELIDNELAAIQATHPNESATRVTADESIEELSYTDGDDDESFAVDKETSSSRSLEDCVFTYQAADGQYIYLDPLNIAMLREEYGLLPRCPDRIRVKILNITHHVVSEQLRGRYKWMSHLPLMCELQFFEVFLQPPLISRCVMDNYRDNIEKRRISRQIKQKKEDVCEKRAAAYWSKTYPNFTPSESVDTLLDLSVESFTPLPSVTASDVTEPVRLGSSFAQALSQQYVSKPADTQSIPSTTMDDTLTEQKQGSTDSDDEFAPPSYSESLGDAIATRLDAYLQQKDTEAVPKSKVASGTTRGKRGKAKKIVLFSTSSGRPT